MEVYMNVKDLALEGNLIDNGWIENLKYDNGKTNLNAVMILSEIVYWYRPTEIRNESSGQIEGYKKKFRADKLQKTYQALGDRFGLSKRQAKDACDFLKSKDIISVEFRTIKTESGSLPNVMFIEPIFENLKAITGINRVTNKKEQDSYTSSGGYPTLKRNTSSDKIEDSLRSMVVPPTTECNTNTDTSSVNTTDTKTTITPDISLGFDLSLKSKDDYLVSQSKSDTQKLNKIFTRINLQSYETDIRKMLQYSLEDMYFSNLFANKIDLPLTSVRARLSELTTNMVDRAINKYTMRLCNNPDIEIKKPGPYFSRCIWSALTEQALDNLLELEN